MLIHTYTNVYIICIHAIYMLMRVYIYICLYILTSDPVGVNDNDNNDNNTNNDDDNDNDDDVVFCEEIDNESKSGGTYINQASLRHLIQMQRVSGTKKEYVPCCHSGPCGPDASPQWYDIIYNTCK